MLFIILSSINYLAIYMLLYEIRLVVVLFAPASCLNTLYNLCFIQLSFLFFSYLTCPRCSSRHINSCFYVPRYFQTFTYFQFIKTHTFTEIFMDFLISLFPTFSSTIFMFLISRHYCLSSFKTLHTILFLINLILYFLLKSPVLAAAPDNSKLLLLISYPHPLYFQRPLSF